MVAKTRSQLERRLTEKGHSPEVIEEAINRMIEVGVIDDAAFARNYTSSLHDGRGLARKAISRELHQKGIDQETIEEALEGLDADAEHARAVDLVRKKARSTANLEPQARVRRLVGMLARKGYPGNVAFSVVKEVLAEESPEIKDMENPD
jgi:regulatory protein